LTAHEGESKKKSMSGLLMMHWAHGNNRYLSATSRTRTGRSSR
jgi:hypothetical protein